MENTKYATGRRKTSIAKVWLSKGSGKILVNGKDFKEYFKRPNHQMQITRPFEIINQTLLGRVAAVDDQLRAGNERRFIRGQIKRAVSNILRLPQPGKRRRVQSLSLELRVGDGFLRHISLDDSRMNRVTPDAIGGVLDCGGFGEKPHRSLGCTIGG